MSLLSSHPALPPPPSCCPQVLMDEVSTGLDSATTFSLVQTLAHVAHALR